MYCKKSKIKGGFKMVWENVLAKFKELFGGEGETVEETIKDFLGVYEGMKKSYEQEGHKAADVEFEFYYDTASFLSEYAGVFSLSGLEKLTGVSQAQLGHYLHGRRKPSRKTINKIQNGVDHFAKELTAIKFA